MRVRDFFDIAGIVFNDGVAIYSGSGAPITNADATGEPIPEGSIYISITGGVYQLLNGVWKERATHAPAGGDGSLQYNLDGVFAGVPHLVADVDGLSFENVTSPAAPPADHVRVVGKTLAGRTYPSVVCEDGYRAELQPAAWRKHQSHWNPSGNTNSVPGLNGLNAFTSVGSLVARAISTANRLTRARRLGYVSTKSAGSVTGAYHAYGVCTLDQSPSVGGGFFYSCRFGVAESILINNARMFVGLAAALNAPTSVEPSTLVNCIGVGKLSTDPDQLYLLYGGTVAQTPIPLGLPPDRGVPYEFTINAVSNTPGVVRYRLERLDTGEFVEGMITPTVQGVQLPSAMTLLSPRHWRANVSGNSQVEIDIINVYLETDI